MIKIDYRKFIWDRTWFGWWASSWCDSHKKDFVSDCAMCRDQIKWHYAPYSDLYDSPGRGIVLTDNWLHQISRF